MRPMIWDDSWLSSRTEEAIEPGLPIIDPHHHLWQREGMSRYMLDDLLADTGAGHNVEATVFVDCVWGYRASGPKHLRPVGESETAAALASQSVGRGTEIRGIVGFADMTLGDSVDEVLAVHIDAARGLFRGIRHATAYDPDPRISRLHTRPTSGLMGEPAFRRGVGRLASFDLTFDAMLFHPQIRELTDLARAVPEVTFILDHLGGILGIGPYAGKREEILQVWRVNMDELATCPNVVVKVGGIGMVDCGLGFETWTEPPSSDNLVKAWREPITHVIERFGPERCMFESNFPVDKMSCGYVELWNAFKKIAVSASADVKASLFHDTAARVYRV